jgi:hypothetical protein
MYYSVRDAPAEKKKIMVAAGIEPLFFLWIGFWLSRDLLLQGVQFFGTN